MIVWSCLPKSLEKATMKTNLASNIIDFLLKIEEIDKNIRVIFWLQESGSYKT